MSLKTKLPYPPEEVTSFQKMTALMDAWKTKVAESKIFNRDNPSQEYTGKKLFSSDGFFPHYYSQKTKILFIGRENRDVADSYGDSYLDLLVYWYKKEKLGSRQFHQRMIYIAYGILNGGNIPYGEIPHPDKIIEDFATPKGISFSIMNLSKYANPFKGSSTCDVGLIAKFLKDSNIEERNFFKEEFSILAPDIIITMNLWRFLEWRPYLKNIFEGHPENPGVNTCHRIEINGKQIPVINLYHFSSFTRSNQYDFYNPAMKLFKESFLGK